MKLGIRGIKAGDMVIVSKCKYYFSAMLLLIVDYLAIICAAFLAKNARDHIIGILGYQYAPLNLSDFFIYGFIPCVFIFFIAYTELYTKRLPLWQCMERVFRVCLYVNALIIIFTYAIRRPENMSHLFLALLFVMTFINLCLFRYISKEIMVHFGMWQMPVLFIGAGRTAELLVNRFEVEPSIGYKIVGLIEDHSEDRPLTQRYPVVGSFDDIEKVLGENSIDNVILATPGIDRAELVKLLYRVQPHVRNLMIVPDLFGIPMSNISVDSFYSEKTLVLNLRNNLAVGRNRILKRLFDFCASVLGTIMISPILLILAFLIYRSSPGPVIFSHMRIGTNGKIFPCYKFRSMVSNAQECLDKYLEENPEAKKEWNCYFKLKEDPRVTKIGAFLRKTSLDELPQLFNVIKGEMSLVGPRPIIDKEIEKYGEYINEYYLVRPGMTGYWQVSGRSDTNYEDRVQMDAWYVHNWSLWQDVVMLVKTISVVFRGKGAY